MGTKPTKYELTLMGNAEKRSYCKNRDKKIKSLENEGMEK